ncbi:multidrug effflux MFS transporter [Donghicola sp. C2-DW-16]|uniref:Bcr/CflA family efflux transporter n=1 Tax=Donghicola mangrovi TaxID=2729614 RepID=A0A850Q099_9RHOB|nr:multidrug effflux MFS transporter [Donghicola mangrovi]NVO22957.1 multidrug effflux MFS transporter [Donghicola mangrovi]NVO27903.1 multidrug effflux MFS transporter [Donghicola mangrovi]
MFAAPTKPLKFPEFVGMLAMLFATLAFSIDSMLPAIPQIAQQMTPDDLNRAQFIITSFVMGMGIGTFFAGPLSDWFGRKITVAVGIAIYMVAALYAANAQDLEHLLISRFIMGLGASAPRVVSLAMVRDLYKGREMARIMSFVMTVFILVPAAAPSVGALIISYSSWRGVFVAFVVFALFSGSWLMIRQPETLAPENRRPLSWKAIRYAFGEVLGNRLVVMYTAALSLGFGLMFSFISSAPQLFTEAYDRTDSFPIWFAGVAGFAAMASFINARLVMTLGMRLLSTSALFAQFAATIVALVLLESGLIPVEGEFYVFIAYMAVSFFMIGLVFGNINALAMEPLGHVAGFAAAIIGAISTILAVLVAVPVGYSYDGTPLPLMIGVLVCSGIAWLIMIISRRYDVLQTV